LTLSREDRRAIETSGLFDAEWYLRYAPEAAASDLDPLEHYASIGWKAGRSPGPYFDGVWYREFYNDVDAAGCEPLLHFIRYGKREGRHMRAPEGSLFDAFQSLGDDCEFGFVQDRAGSRTLGLFRFAATSVDGLIAAFKNDLRSLILPDTMDVRASNNEYHVGIPTYDIWFHTTVLTETMTREQIKAHEFRRLAFLLRKLIEDLEEGNKIFVYKAQQHTSLTKLKELVSLLRQYGDNNLLYVSLAESVQQRGAFEPLAPGLAAGFIDRVHGKLSTRSFKIWSVLCKKAYAHWSPSVKAAASAP